MAFSVTNTFTGASILDPADLDENFDDVEAILNAGLTTSNLASAAGLTNAQLANDDFVFTVNLTCNGTIWNTGIGKVALCGLPDTTQSIYTVIGYSWACTDVGDQLGNIVVQWGSYSGVSNAWVSAATILPSTNMGSDAGANTAGSTTGTRNVDLTPTAAGGKPLMFALLNAATGTGVMSSALDLLSVTLLVKRKNGLGSY